MATNGSLYGTTENGGAYGFGTVFKMTLSGALTTLVSFGISNGETPEGGLIQASDDNFYGTAFLGSPSYLGLVFKMTPSGTISTVHSFCSLSNCADGFEPSAALVEGSDGELYGNTQQGGPVDCPLLGGGGPPCGSLFKVSKTGTFTTLHGFDFSDGAFPEGGMILDSNGIFYGTTWSGGDYNSGVFFTVTSAGTYSVLYSLLNNGYGSRWAVTEGSDHNIYGANPAGGNYGGGTFYSYIEGTVTSLYSFCQESGCTDGSGPQGVMLEATNGVFYGTTYNGGSSSSCTGGCGTIFKVNTPLSPYIATHPSAAPVGATVEILGTNLSGTESVSFNGTPATFIVHSPFLVSATVPAGATTGSVQLVTPSRTLSTISAFQVRP